MFLLFFVGLSEPPDTTRRFLRGFSARSIGGGNDAEAGDGLRGGDAGHGGGLLAGSDRGLVGGSIEMFMLSNLLLIRGIRRIVLMRMRMRMRTKVEREIEI